MATVVITGSTKGIGRGLANEFARLGHNVVISSRSEDDIINVSEQMNSSYEGSVIGQACDISKKRELEALWQLAKSEFGTVDYWINNAGFASSYNKVHKVPQDLVSSMISTNSLGTVFGSQVAVNGFRSQGQGSLYNMLGGSYDGKFLTPGMGIYSSTKASINILTKYLVEENKNTGVTIASISPGVLITENWLNEQKKLSHDEWEKARPMANIICDHVETVTPWIVSEILRNKKSGIRIAWMPFQKILLRFFKAKILRQSRDVLSRYGI